MSYRTFGLLFGALLVWAGCDGEEGDTDAGEVRLDSGGGVDAGGEEDAGGTPVDGGSDAGMADAGSDAGPPVPVMPAAAGDVVITEIQAAPIGYCEQPEWIEIHNPSATVTYNLNGCQLDDNALPPVEYTIPTDVIIPPGGYVVISSATFTEEANGFVSDHSYEGNVGGFSGGGDSPAIACGGVTIDAVAYGVAAGFPDIDDSGMPGYTLSLDPSGDATTNDVGGNWCYGAVVYHAAAGCPAEEEDPGMNYGSPGEANPACPE